MPTVKPSIENLRSLGQITQNFRWLVEIEKFPILVPGFTSDDINFRAESMTMPKLNPNMTEITIRGNKRFQTGLGEYENPITLTCIETVDNKISRFLKAWREACWESDNGGTGKSNDHADVEATLLLIQLTNKDLPRWYFKLFGCILETASHGDDASADSVDPYKPALGIRYDYFNDWPAA